MGGPSNPLQKLMKLQLKSETEAHGFPGPLASLKKLPQLGLAEFICGSH